MDSAKKVASAGLKKLLRPISYMLENQDMRLNEIETKQNELIRKVDHVNESMINSGVLAAGEHEIIVKLFNGLKIYLDTRDVSLTPHIALDGIWEPDITKAWTSLISPNDTVFDIGANFGYFGLLAGHLTNKKKARVVFFEPNPHLVTYIKKTINLNWYNEQSRIEGVAVSDDSGRVSLNILEGYTASSSIQSVTELQGYLGEKMDIKLYETVEVPAIRIDDYCKDNGIKTLDLIKMDVEGHEDKAYSGMREIIKKSPDPKLFIEFTKEAYKDPQAFYETLVSDFGHVATINPDGTLHYAKRTSFKQVVEQTDDWVMLVFSKRKLV